VNPVLDFPHTDHALYVAPDLGRYVLAAGWFGHCLWDIAHHVAKRVVPRWYAEYCAVADVLARCAILFVPYPCRVRVRRCRSIHPDVCGTSSSRQVAPFHSVCRRRARISTLSIFLLADSLHPLPLYKGERQIGHATDQRRAEGARNDRPRRTETAPRGAYARSGVVPPEKGIASEPQGTGRLPVDFDRGVGADAVRWPSSQVLPNTQEHRLEAWPKTRAPRVAAEL
jgi:hypothetical protein